MSRITERIIRGEATDAVGASILKSFAYLISQEIPRTILPVILSILLMMVGWRTIIVSWAIIPQHPSATASIIRRSGGFVVLVIIIILYSVIIEGVGVGSIAWPPTELLINIHGWMNLSLCLENEIIFDFMQQSVNIDYVRSRPILIKKYSLYGL